MKSLANLSALGNFVGMLTDSRSFLSYTRHDYFRRILCQFIGGLVENGEYPYDDKLLSEIVKGISYNNAIEYFGFNLDKVWLKQVISMEFKYKYKLEPSDLWQFHMYYAYSSYLCIINIILRVSEYQQDKINLIIYKVQ